MSEHGTALPSDIFPYDSNGRGIHTIRGFNSVSTETERESIVQQTADRGRVIEQTGGLLPGYYVADGTGNWFYLGGDPNISGTLNLTLISTNRNIDLYVDNINGNDSNDGSSSNPLKTVIEAESRIPYIVNHRVIIHVLPYDTSIPNVGYYTWPVFTPRLMRESIFVISENFEILSSGIAQSGSNRNKLVTSGGMTTDEYVNMYASIRITSGLANGDIKTISENTITDIVPSCVFTDTINAGDTYEIVRPLIRYYIPSISGESVLARGVNVSKGAGTGKTQAALWLINGIIEKEATSTWLLIDNIQIFFFGVTCINEAPFGSFSINSNAPIIAGYEALDYSVLPWGYKSFTLNELFPNFCITKTSLGGWGLSIFAYSSQFSTHIGGFDGFLVFPGLLDVGNWAYTTISQKERTFVYLRGGRLNHLKAGNIHEWTDAVIRIKADPNIGIPYNEFLFRANDSTELILCMNAYVTLFEVDMQQNGDGGVIYCMGRTGKVLAMRCQGFTSGIAWRTKSGGVIERYGLGTFSGTIGDISEDDGITLRNWNTLIVGTFFNDTIQGSVICYPSY